MKSSHGRHWRDLAFEYQEIAALRSASLQRVWLLAETMEDQAVAQEIRTAIVGDFLGVGEYE